MGKIFSLLSGLILFGAISSSSHYQLQSFSVNSGGSNTTQSTNYKARATTGEVANFYSLSTNYVVDPGSITAGTVNPPGFLTLSNGSNTYYNKIHFIVNTAGNPSDVVYAVGFWDQANSSVINYVQADGTYASTPYYQTYSAWGGASGSFATNLKPSTTYSFFAQDRQSIFGGAITEGGSNPVSTVAPALSFSISDSLVNFGGLFVDTAETSGGLSFNFSTNAANGGYIYMAGSYTGLHSTATGYTIQTSPPSSDLNSTNEGFGISVYGGSSLVAQSPYSTGSNYIVGAIYTTFQPILSATGPVTSDTGTGVISARSHKTTPAANDYTDTLTFVAAANY